MIYTYGQFYNPRFKVGAEFDPDSYALSNHLIPSDVAKDYETEKGKDEEIESTITEWPLKSQYRILADIWKDTSLENRFTNPDPDIIICDDIGKESADFIYCYLNTTTPKVVFFHCKAQKYRELKQKYSLNIKYNYF